jgi:hypothetical protein
MASESSEAKPEATMEESPQALRNNPTVITSVPAGVTKAFSSHLSSNQKQLMVDLCSSEYGQLHLFEKWDQTKADKVSPAMLRQMANQIMSLDESYPGGLREYIKTAKKLLAGTYVMSKRHEAKVSGVDRDSSIHSNNICLPWCIQPVRQEQILWMGGHQVSLLEKALSWELQNIPTPKRLELRSLAVSVSSWSLVA